MTWFESKGAKEIASNPLRHHPSPFLFTVTFSQVNPSCLENRMNRLLMLGGVLLLAGGVLAYYTDQGLGTSIVLWISGGLTFAAGLFGDN